MAETRSMVSICFKNAPQQLFRGTAVERLHPNWVVLGIQPEECLRVEMMAKEPGLDLRTGQISLDARLHPEGSERSDAYEGLLLDVMEGDRSLFLRYDEIEWAWRCLLYTSPSPRDRTRSRMPSSACKKTHDTALYTFIQLMQHYKNTNRDL